MYKTSKKHIKGQATNPKFRSNKCIVCQNDIEYFYIIDDVDGAGYHNIENTLKTKGIDLEDERNFSGDCKIGLFLTGKGVTAKPMINFGTLKICPQCLGTLLNLNSLRELKGD